MDFSAYRAYELLSASCLLPRACVRVPNVGQLYSATGVLRCPAVTLRNVPLKSTSVQIY